MSPDDVAKLKDESNLPPLVHELLTEGKAVIDAERRRKELEEQAAEGARRALLAVNSRVAAEVLVEHEPKAARLMPWVKPIEDTLAFASPPEFREMRFEFNIRGFNPVRVKVHRSWRHGESAEEGRFWEPWQVEPFEVVYANSSKTTPQPSLGVALAVAREQWLIDNKDSDVPF